MPLAGRGLSSTTVALAGRGPQLKRDPLGGGSKVPSTMRTLLLVVLSLLAHQTLSAQAPSDAQAATALVRKLGFKVDRLAGTHPPYYVFIVTRHQDSVFMVVARTGRPPAVIGKPIGFGPFLPSEIRWVQLPNSVLVLDVAFDNPVEGMLGTFLYRMRDDSLEKFFQDGSDSCAPAALTDLDHDGVPELLAHTEDPSHGDCGEPCEMSITERFHVTPGWLEVRRWRGGEFSLADRDFPGFYGDLARRYDAVAEWLKSDTTFEAQECRRVYWLEDQDFFAKLASRAREVEARGRETH